jgi:diaminohydroxyphosphoribosylaminopyrimidine deaminase/5-amino-6-(5-phosphoribosylamino)uracil reductase
MAFMHALDRQRLQEALTLAQQAIGLSDPNPRVGCVIGHEDGRILAQGHTQAAGQAHAEAAALQAARAAGVDVRGATAWVTLEPCAHHGRTPPCADALVGAGIARVVVGVGDPFAQVSGRGIARLRAAGIQVDVLQPDGPDAGLAQACHEINIGFFQRCRTGRPWVRLKVAASVDGRTALPDGSSQWITGEAARADGHAWRRRAGAVLTGIGTVLEDDPRLDVRLVPTARQPLRVVVDSHLMTPAAARILQPPGEVLIASAAQEHRREQALAATGAAIWRAAGPHGQVDLPALLDELGRRQINELHVEAGRRLNASMLRAGLVNECLIYLAPTFLGDGLEMAALGTLPRLDEAARWRFTDCRMVGGDVRLMLRTH